MNLFKNIHIPVTKSLVWLELFLIVACCCLYVYSIVSSVVDVVLREELQVSVREADSRVSELQSTYLARVNTLTEERATEMGLVALSDVAYVDVTTTGSGLSRRD